MNQEDQGKKASPAIIDVALQEIIPARPTELSDEDLDKVAGGFGEKLSDTERWQTRNTLAPLPPPK